VSDDESGPDACAECGRPAEELTQETDIFDTWFSSGLWPFSTLGWPDATPDLQRFYPTSLMETAYEILFFWVARMMMLGLFLTDVEPFHTVYLHGIVRDPTGAKMSKTKGNVVDPLEMIGSIGADALRFALVSGNAPGVDQRLTDAKLTGGRNFTNKLWNAARFVLGARPEPMVEPSSDATLAARWIRSRLGAATERATRQLDELDLAGYTATVYEAAWSDYCDWFLEMAKVDLRREGATDADRAATWLAAADGLATLLRLLHPLMPFVTEEIWQALGDVEPRATAGEPLLISAAWPIGATVDPDAEAAFADLSELVREVRNLRTAAGTPAGAWVPLVVEASGGAAEAALDAGRAYLEVLAHVRPIERRTDGERPALVAATPLGAAWLGEDSATSDRSTERRAARIAELEANVERVRALLENEAFTSRAPAAVVDQERQRLAELEEQLRQLRH
jgi:valyl-tRNA synthetase